MEIVLGRSNELPLCGCVSEHWAVHRLAHPLLFRLLLGGGSPDRVNDGTHNGLIPAYRRQSRGEEFRVEYRTREKGTTRLTILHSFALVLLESPFTSYLHVSI